MSLSHCTHSSTDDFMSASDGVPLRLQSQGALDTTMHMGDSVASRCPSTTDRVEGFERSGSSAERRKPNGALFLHARKPSTKHKRLSLSTGRPSGETSALAIARRHPSIDAQLHPTQTGTVAVEVDSDWVDPYDLNAIKFNTRFLLKELKPGSERGWKAQPVSIATPKGRQGVNMSPYASRPEGTLPLNPKRKPESQDDTRHIEGDGSGRRGSGPPHACPPVGNRVLGSQTPNKQGLLSSENKNSPISVSNAAPAHPTSLQRTTNPRGTSGPTRRKSLPAGAQDKARGNPYKTHWKRRKAFNGGGLILK